MIVYQDLTLNVAMSLFIFKTTTMSAYMRDNTFNVDLFNT